jgi:hypothetical protein
MPKRRKAKSLLEKWEVDGENRKKLGITKTHKGLK